MTKTYIEVCAIFDVSGVVKPIWFKWVDGRVYEIEKIVEICQAVSLKSGGAGTRYTIKVYGQIRYLFCEAQNIMNRHAFCRWFIEK